MVQLVILAALAVILTCLFVVSKKRRTPVPEVQSAVQPSPQMPPQPVIKVEVVVQDEAHRAVVNEAVHAPQPVVVDAQPITVPPDRNQKILAGISENIRKSLIKPMPTYSLIDYPEKPRDTEYIRIKKQIITPHGQVRFSILKDSISSNMMAVFRRASLDWKTADDLIGFVPAYLEPQAEILNSEVLLVGTAGHNEKLAIPLRTVDAGSCFYDCFDFVTDVRSTTNTPAVLLASDAEFEVVSRGVIAQPVFLNRVERSQTEVKLLIEQSSEVLATSQAG